MLQNSTLVLFSIHTCTHSVAPPFIPWHKMMIKSSSYFYTDLAKDTVRTSQGQLPGQTLKRLVSLPITLAMCEQFGEGNAVKQRETL